MSDSATERDVMQDDWCCLSCGAKFRFGKLRFGQTGLTCPTCRSENTAAADGRIYDDPPKALDTIADVVLAYRPKPKSKPAKKRKRRAAKATRDRQKNA